MLSAEFVHTVVMLLRCRLLTPYRSTNDHQPSVIIHMCTGHSSYCYVAARLVLRLVSRICGGRDGYCLSDGV